ncbi:phage tail assembly protein [Oculatella sp. LEGE 06141]|uniref:phage tail assembly protein n=1 Tax=Oculatella sp. LEGE 06141 TaxID=1828648 RepID=UPI0018814C82|nr:phage tail assembly protein [Oculatella sp. LEGE 06141]MBE9181984.1 phage tail assembly protein [Oculatella sp. LEGE 06141]
MARKDKPCTEFSFTLPRGWTDDQNRVHRQGRMRLATAKDELCVQREPSVRDNPAYAALIMLSRVIVRLGSLTSVTPTLLEQLTIRDIAYLREFYNRLNQQGDVHVPAQCPHCQTEFAVELTLSGES